MRLNNSSWFQLHVLSPTIMATGDLDGNGQDEVILDFPGLGVWVRYNNAAWVQLHKLDATGVTVGDIDGNGRDDVILSFPDWDSDLLKQRRVVAATSVERHEDGDGRFQRQWKRRHRDRLWIARSLGVA